MIEAKIVVRVPGLASGRQNMLILLVSLMVMTALPPEGGAAQAMTLESRISFHSQAFLSYMPSLSMKILSSSIGGYAP
jgi:hypothetical protein